MDTPDRVGKGDSRPDRWMVWLIVLVGVLAGGALLILWHAHTKPNTLGFEVAKALLQLLVVAVVATPLSIATFNYQRRRDRLRENQMRKDELLRALLTDALGAYHQVKRARRLLRAQVWAAPSRDRVKVEVYDEQFAVVNDAQLDFERLALLTESLDDPRINSGGLRAHLTTVEKTLGRLVTEYELQRSNVDPGGRIAAIELAELKLFLDHARSGSFRGGVADPIKNLSNALQGALLVPLEKQLEGRG